MSFVGYQMNSFGMKRWVRTTIISGNIILNMWFADQEEYHLSYMNDSPLEEKYREILSVIVIQTYVVLEMQKDLSEVFSA